MSCIVRGCEMDFVEPIRDKRKITQIKNFLAGAERPLMRWMLDPPP